MKFEELKDGVKGLSENDLRKLIAYAHHIQWLRDPDEIEKMRQRKADRDPSKLVTVDEFEALLDSR